MKSTAHGHSLALPYVLNCGWETVAQFHIKIRINVSEICKSRASASHTHLNAGRKNHTKYNPTRWFQQKCCDFEHTQNNQNANQLILYTIQTIDKRILWHIYLSQSIIFSISIRIKRVCECMRRNDRNSKKMQCLFYLFPSRPIELIKAIDFVLFRAPNRIWFIVQVVCHYDTINKVKS